MERSLGLLFHVLTGLFLLGSSVQAKIQGIPGLDYPNYNEVPVTSFNCLDQDYVPGIYADIETGCQVFHYCYEHRKESFLCPPGTTFNQPLLACDYWYSSNCSISSIYFNVNDKNQNRLHNNIPIVVKLQPDSWEKISDSSENSFEEMSSLYNSNSQFLTRSRLEEYLSLDHSKVERNFEDRFRDTELQSKDLAKRKSRSMDNLEPPYVEDDDSSVGFDVRNLYSQDQEVTNEKILENNDNRFNPFGITSKEFYPEISYENFEAGPSPFIDYEASEGQSAYSNSDNEETLNSDEVGTKDIQSDIFTGFSKRLQAESSPKRSRRKPYYIVSEEIEAPKLSLKPQQRWYPYVQPTVRPDVTVTTEMHSEPLTTDSVWNIETDFAADTEAPEQLMVLPTEASDIPDIENPLNELDGSSLLSELEEGHFRTAASDLEHLEMSPEMEQLSDHSVTENLPDESLLKESSVDSEPVAAFHGEGSFEYDLDKMVSDEIPQEETEYHANQEHQDVSPEESDTTDIWIQNPDEHSQYIPESYFLEGFSDENFSDYEESYPLYLDDYSYQPEIYSDNQYSADDEWNSEFRPYFITEEERNMYADSSMDYRIEDPSDERSPYQPYGKLRSLDSLQYDESQSESAENLRNRLISGLTGDAQKPHSPLPSFIQNSQYVHDENMFYSGLEEQNDDSQYGTQTVGTESFQNPSHHILENYSKPIYTFSDGSSYIYNQPIDRITEDLEDMHLLSGIKDSDLAESQSDVPYRNVLPSVDYVLPEREYYGRDEEQYSSEEHEQEQSVANRRTKENGELDNKDSKGHPRHIEELLEKWEEIYLKSLQEYLNKSKTQFSNDSKVFEEREGEQVQASQIPEDVRKKLARDAWKRLDLTGTTLCEISRDDLSFKHLLTGKGITEDIREELKREALKAVYAMCFPKLEDDEEFKELTEDYVDFWNVQTKPELDEDDSSAAESEIMAVSEDFSHKAGKDMTENLSSHKTEDELDISGQNENVQPESVHTGFQTHDEGVLFDGSKIPQMFEEQVTEEKVPEDLEAKSIEHDADSAKDKDLLKIPLSTSEVSDPGIFEKFPIFSDPEQKFLETSFVPSDFHGKGKALGLSDPKKESVVTKSPEFESSNNQEQSTLAAKSVSSFKSTTKPKVVKSVLKENKQFGGSGVQFMNEAQLLNQLVLGNSKKFASQSFGNFPLELQQQHYNSVPSPIQELFAGQAFSGSPGAKAALSRSSSLPRKILSMKGQKLNLLKKYLQAIQRQR